MMFEGLSGKGTWVASNHWISDIHGRNYKRPDAPIRGALSSSEGEESRFEISIGFSQIKLQQVYFFFFSNKQKK